MTKAAKKAELIKTLEAELAAAIATKDAANDAMDADRFYAACSRVRDLEHEIHLAHRGPLTGCSITRQLVADNID